MKKTKRIAAMIAALAMMATMAVPFTMTASAADVKVKVQTDGAAANQVTNVNPDKDTAEHTYTAYEIFKGENVWTSTDSLDSSKGEFKFNITGLGGGVNWSTTDGLLKDGSDFMNLKPDGNKTIAQVIAALGADATDAQKVAAAIARVIGDNIATGSDEADELAKIFEKAKIDENGKEVTTEGVQMAEGYYLVTDSYTDGANNDAVSKFILQVAKKDGDTGIVIVPKKSYPEVIKKVQENAKTTTDYSGTKTALQNAVVNSDKWNDVADYCIGSNVPFQLYGSMPETLADYDAYYYLFTDTLSNKFDQPQSVTVKVGTNDAMTFTWNSTTSKYELASGYLKANATAIPAVTHTELIATSTFMTQINEALSGVEGWDSKTDQEKLEYVQTNWNTLTAEGGALVAKGYTSDKSVGDYIKSKTVIDTPAVPVRAEDKGTDGNCRVAWDSTDGKLTVSFENIKAYANVNKDTIVTVNYSAKLNATAVIGLDGQENKVDLTYSNNPNTEYKPVTNDDQPNAPTDEQGTDTTPEDKVVVFTYEADVNKIDADTKVNLAGAEFQLKSGSTAIKFIDNGNGTYTVADQTLTAGVTTTLKSDANGLFKLIGLDDGEYTLTETKAPNGYPTPTGTAADFALVLTATTDNNQTWNGTASSALRAIAGTLNTKAMTVLNSGTVTPNNNTRGNNGGVQGVIENSKSTTLPSTGGMGPILFYTVGGIMVVGAGVVLVTKKRSKNEQ